MIMPDEAGIQMLRCEYALCARGMNEESVTSLNLLSVVHVGTSMQLKSLID